MSDFTTAADMVKHKKKTATPEVSHIQDDSDGRNHLEYLCDQCKTTVYKARDETWADSKKAIEHAVDHLAGCCKLSDRFNAQAQAEEVLMTVRVCQCTADLETANIIPELDRIRRIVGAPQTARGAMY